MNAASILDQLLGSNTPTAVDRLFAALTVMSILVTAALCAMVVVWGIKYRASARPRRAAPLNVSRIEIAGLCATLVTFLSLAVWANVVFIRQRTAPPDAYTVFVEGKQWMWKIEHPSGRREINELHVPVGRPVRVVLTSSDVVHSFFLPRWRVKQDAVPGHYTSLWFVAESPASEHLFCAEYCGTDHSGMIGRVIAMPQAQFTKWLSDEPLAEQVPGMPGTTQPLQIRGASRFASAGCSACHTPTNAVFAPRLDGIWGRPTMLSNGRQTIVDENYVRESIIDPNAKIVAGYRQPSQMPSYAGSLDEQQIRELIEFIRSIRHGWPSQEPDPRPQPKEARDGR